MPVVYKLASYAEFRQECEILRQREFLEVAAPRGAYLGIDHEWYEAVEQTGSFRALIAYDEESDEPVGYMTFVAHSSPHDEERQYVSTDMVFVAPEHRAKLIGIQLYKLAEAEISVSWPECVWRATMTVDGAQEGKKRDGLSRLGFKATEVVFEKVIGDERSAGITS